MTFDIERQAGTRMEERKPAPGQPGSPPRWTTGAKTAVGTAVSLQSRIWFTISQGIVNDIYFPTIDQANLRAARFLIADERGFFSDEECDAVHSVEPIRSDVPAFRLHTRWQARRLLDCQRVRCRSRRSADAGGI
ncbi:MAG: hypothetical protein ACRD4O_10240 [Bryobacteraceae bacterium]